ncbi:MAG: rubrerythrin family protein [Chitinivibrionales bacterium]|nr:rubrerythrin family protein [Chitinivibrionales bacterium]
MNKKKLSRLMLASVMLEKKVSELYLLFARKSPQDYDFWWQLAIEEQNHAALLRSVEQYFLALDLLPDNLVPRELETIEAINERVDKLIEEYTDMADIARSDMFAVALQLEKSAGEQHLQIAVSGNEHNKAIDLIRQLNQDDKDHAERIVEYAREQGIS